MKQRITVTIEKELIELIDAEVDGPAYQESESCGGALHQAADQDSGGLALMTYEPDSNLVFFLERIKESIKGIEDYQIRIEPKDDGRGKSLLAQQTMKKIQQSEMLRR